MPCRGSEPREELAMASQYIKELKEKLDLATRVACSTLTFIEEESYYLSDYLSQEVVYWWEEHKIWDQKRRQAEAQAKLEEEKNKARQKIEEEILKIAISKLTEEEKAVLGLL